MEADLRHDKVERKRREASRRSFKQPIRNLVGTWRTPNLDLYFDFVIGVKVWGEVVVGGGGGGVERDDARRVNANRPNRRMDSDWRVVGGGERRRRRGGIRESVCEDILG